MKGFIFGVILTLAAVTAGGIAYLWLGLADFRGDEPRSEIETYIVRNAVHASIKRNAPELRSPVPPTDLNLTTGGRMYQEQCARCHGSSGRQESEHAQGALAASELAKEYTESQIFWIAKHGIRWTGMPASDAADSDAELWALAAYIKRLNHLPPHVKDELAKLSTSTSN